MKASRRQHPLAAAMIALALLVRLAVPAGWMPSGQGTAIMPCPGAGAMPMRADHAMSMAGKAGDPHQHDDGRNHDCPFAPFAAALIAPHAPAADLPTAVAESRAPAPSFAVAVGRGLAAPPPPQTGPPLLA